MSHDKRTSFELVIVAAGGVFTAAFTQVRDSETNQTNLHAPWNVVAILPSRSPRRHVCTIATSREARSLLTAHGAEHIDEAFVARGIARLYRRNVDQILGVPDASITIEIGHLEVFVPMVRADAVARVQIEVENLAVDLALLVARAGAAIPPLPAPVAWTNAEPLLRSHPAHAAMREFYEHYADIRTRILAEAPFVATAARRGVNLAAMALLRSPVPPFAGIRVTSTGPSRARS